ncbi:hypothetical protein [Streptomyces sp. NPDC002176]|uniref:hypothetical protein n=1 Tax=Streptomyces sp. NPDC002176 TaxID=3364634 RepID=UPI00384F821D
MSTLLGAALISALTALRPTFPKDDRPIWREEFASGGGESGRTSSSVPRCPVNRSGLPEREPALTVLAHRKFRAIKVTVDLIVAAISVAGLVLLLTFHAS